MDKLRFKKPCGCCGACCEKGKGLCPKCQREENERNEAEWQKAEKMIADGLNPTNREKFLAMELELRRGLVLQAIEDGILYWDIVGSRPANDPQCLSTLSK